MSTGYTTPAVSSGAYQVLLEDSGTRCFQEGRLSAQGRLYGLDECVLCEIATEWSCVHHVKLDLTEEERVQQSSSKVHGLAQFHY
ncbi:hypothetical protein CCR75_004194 [Bremia lactucae]|uniref:Uncharacterized protein n=1 Tax=Bremia lactucae TaxID=4779 RepID=A0A976IDN2_BRELC|nr:hypothetical protein CCR75_004194 [Bremia lactucae]